MSRVAELLTAVASVLRAMTEHGGQAFTEVRAELDRYDLSDLIKDSTRTPTARVCLLRAKPVRGGDGRMGLDVAIAIIVVAGREGRANPEFSSADLAALRLMDLCTVALMSAPSVGLGRISDVDLGDALVALAEQSNDRGVAIALQEAKWRLHDVYQPAPAAAAALALSPETVGPTSLTINGVGQPLPGGET